MRYEGWNEIERYCLIHPHKQAHRIAHLLEVSDFACAVLILRVNV